MKRTILRMPIGKIVLASLFFGFFLAMSFVPDIRNELINDNALKYWTVNSVLTIFIALCALLIFKRPTLTLDLDGFEVTSFKGKQRTKWQETGPLSIHTMSIKRPKGSMIVFDRFVSEPETMTQTVNRALVGHNDGVAVHYGLKAQEQLALMEKYRSAALQQNQDETDV